MEEMSNAEKLQALLDKWDGDKIFDGPRQELALLAKAMFEEKKEEKEYKVVKLWYLIPIFSYEDNDDDDNSDKDILSYSYGIISRIENMTMKQIENLSCLTSISYPFDMEIPNNFDSKDYEINDLRLPPINFANSCMRIRQQPILITFSYEHN